MTYAEAVRRAVRALAGDIRNGTNTSSAAVADAVGIYLGDHAATHFPAEAIECVTRDVLVSFGNQYSARLRKSLGERFGPEVAEVADRLIGEAISEALAEAAKRLRR